jgi:DNA modification methylase
MIFTGDCREVMAGFEPESIDAIVCDPPYDLVSIGKRFSKPDAAPVIDTFGGQYARLAGGFMGKAWDGTGVAFDPKTWEAAYRVAKPGAYLLAFGGTRTYHRMVVAIEDAGWEIRDCLVWGYASGFPKSLDVSKAIDKAAGAERAVLGGKPGNSCDGNPCRCTTDNGRYGRTVHAPATAPAIAWQDWGTALKPAWEPIVMARKPLAGTVAANVLQYGTGAINIDGCRIGTNPGYHYDADHNGTTFQQGARIRQSAEKKGADTIDSSKGRWPANVILTDPIFDGDVEGVVGGGETSSGWSPGFSGPETEGLYGHYARNQINPDAVYGDSGTYSRFFLIPKASRADREPTLDATLDATLDGGVWGGEEDDLTAGKKRTVARRNDHPTVKPLELMRHLVRLVTPPGGTVLDPFAGSGTTLLAAQAEGFDYIGIEMDPHYVEICEARLNGAPRGMGL